MRPGEDRHQVGAEVFGLLFPSEEPLVRGLAIGADAATAEAALGPATEGSGRWERVWTPEDPNARGRRVHVSVSVRTLAQAGGTLVDGVTVRWVSADRLDIDSAWARIKEHLDRQHGAPGRETGNVLKLVWTVGNGPARIVGCRFRDHDGNNLLELVTRAKADGARS